VGAPAPAGVEGAPGDRHPAHALDLDSDRLRAPCAEKRLRLVDAELDREGADAL